MHYETLPAASGRAAEGIFSKAWSRDFPKWGILIQDPDKLDKMEDTIADLTKKVVDMPQHGDEQLKSRG